MGDQMECETFAKFMTAEYGVDLVKVWHKEMRLEKFLSLLNALRKPRLALADH